MLLEKSGKWNKIGNIVYLGVNCVNSIRANPRRNVFQKYVQFSKSCPKISSYLTSTFSPQDSHLLNHLRTICIRALSHWTTTRNRLHCYQCDCSHLTMTTELCVVIVINVTNFWRHRIYQVRTGPLGSIQNLTHVLTLPLPLGVNTTVRTNEFLSSVDATADPEARCEFNWTHK